jgi:hypothetical protein
MMKTANLAAALERRRKRQRGSALLIVLVMAAIIAIMLYKELPISAFEAQRQKEELLVMRGGEYKRGVKLFVRKFGRFPASIDELENTNRMRFLRRKYDDPLTGKDDWRLIHAGPGGIITDSKVKNANSKNASTLGQGATFGGFNNSIVQADPDADTPAASSVAMRQRPAPTVNAASLSSTANGDFPPMPNTGQSPMPATANLDANGSANLSQIPGQGAANTATGLSAPPVNASPGNAAVAQQLNQQNPLTPQGQTNAAGQTLANGIQNSSAFPQNATQPGQQQMAGGGIAGVASKAPGKTIKLVNDQTKYALWEFYYDLAKEQSVTMPGAVQPNANGTQNGANGLNNSNNSNSAFGSGSSFGGSNSAFGSNQNANGQSGSSTGIGSQFPSPPPSPNSSNPPQQ